MSRHRNLACVLFVALAFGACESSVPEGDEPGPDPICAVGATQACLCQAGLVGVQLCEGDRWGSCIDCMVVEGVPPDWSCKPEYYADGEACDCECGAYDPDCSVGLPVYCFGDGLDPTPPAPEGTTCGSDAMCVDPIGGDASLTVTVGADLGSHVYLPESRIYLYSEEPVWFRGVRPADLPAPIAGAWLSGGTATFTGLAPGSYWFDVKFIRDTGAFAYLKGQVDVDGDTEREVTEDADWASSEASWQAEIVAHGSRLGYVTVWTSSVDITTATGGVSNDKMSLELAEPGVGSLGSVISRRASAPRCGEDNGDTVRTYIVPEDTWEVNGTKISLEGLEWGPYVFDVDAETCVLVELRTYDRVDTITDPPVTNPNGGDSVVAPYDVITGQPAN